MPTRISGPPFMEDICCCKIIVESRHPNVHSHTVLFYNQRLLSKGS